MSPEINKRFHAFLNQTKQMGEKASIVNEISKGRVESSKDLTDEEVKAYLDNVQQPKTKKDWTPKGGKACDTKRKKILAIFNSIGGTKQDAIDFAENMKGIKKKFNDYNSRELSVIIEAAEAKKQKHIQNFNK